VQLLYRPPYVTSWRHSRLLACALPMWDGALPSRPVRSTVRVYAQGLSRRLTALDVEQSACGALHRAVARGWLGSHIPFVLAEASFMSMFCVYISCAALRAALEECVNDVPSVCSRVRN
jgi:hypothetical protein